MNHSMLATLTITVNARWNSFTHSMMPTMGHSNGSTMDPHAGHNMGSTVDPHAGHNMGSTVDPHAGHNMGSTVDPHAGHNMGGEMHMMKMFFHTDLGDTVLFDGWVTDEAWKLAVTCIGFFIIATLYEGLKVLREHLLRKQVLSVRHQSHTIHQSVSQEVMISETHHTVQARMCSLAHFIQTFLHMIQVFVSYVLMLVFMTYNVYMCLAVVLGSGMGYLLFGWKKSIVVDVNDHCH